MPAPSKSYLRDPAEVPTYDYGDNPPLVDNPVRPDVPSTSYDPSTGRPWSWLPDEEGANVGASQGAGSPTTYPWLSTFTIDMGDGRGMVTYPGQPSNVDIDRVTPALPTSSNGGSWQNVIDAGGGGNYQDYLNQALGNLSGYGINTSGGNAYGSGVGGTADLEKILLNAGLPALDAQTLAAFAKAREAQLLQAEGVYTTEKDALLEDLFGRGMNRSTVAGEAGGRLLEGQARTLADIESNTALASLQQQNVLADRLQQGAIASGDLRARYRAAQATENAAASNANATRALASANVQAAEINATSKMAATMAELDLKRELGLAELAQGQDQLDYSYWAKEGDWKVSTAAIDAGKPEWWQTLLGIGGAVASSYVGTL